MIYANFKENNVRLQRKERNRDPDKLSPAAANNNRLLIAALPYVALNKIWAPCPELFDQYLSGKGKNRERGPNSALIQNTVWITNEHMSGLCR